VKQADSIALKPGAHREMKLQLNNAAGGRLKRSPDRRQFCFISVLFHEDISLHPSPGKGKIIYKFPWSIGRRKHPLGHGVVIRKTYLNYTKRAGSTIRSSDLVSSLSFLYMACNCETLRRSLRNAGANGHLRGGVHVW